MFFENLDTPSCQPPTVPTEGAPAPCGRTVTSNLPLTGVSWFAEYAYGQLRRKAALPLANALRASSSWYDVTPRGVMVPTQLRWRFSIATAFGLSIVASPPSMRFSPPDEASHSSALQVSPS